MVRIYEYDGCLFPHPVDDPDYCERSHECGEPCMCQIGILKGEFPDIIFGYELMKILGWQDSFIFHYYGKDGEYDYDMGLPKDRINLTLYEHFSINSGGAKMLWEKHSRSKKREKGVKI